MKVLLVTHSYGLNGAALLLRDAASHWVSKLRWQVDALISDVEWDKHGQELINMGVQPKKNITLQGREYDVALVNTLLDVEMVSKLSPFMPIVLWVHEGQTLLFNSKLPVSTLTQAFSQCKSIIFQTAWQTESVFKSFLQHLPSDRIHLIPSGVDIDGVEPKKDHELGKPIKLICVGSVYPRKCQMDLVQAVEKLSQRHAIECLMVGDTSEARDWQARIDSDLKNPNSIIKWLGPIKDRNRINQLLVESDIACFPSGDESHPLALLEAGLNGLPMVISNLPPYKHIGWKDQLNCLMHEVGQIDQIESAIEKLIREKSTRSRIAKQARQMVMDKYDKRDFYSSINKVMMAW
jgi:glycosyltransferase involved in cell wall biosynthesis